MLNIQDLPLGAMVSFDFHPVAMLGTGYKNAKLLAVLDADTARQFIDPVAKHANVYPTLPVGTPDKYDGYYYLKLRLANGSIDVVGIPWIKDETFVQVTTKSMRLTVENVAAADQNKVLEALSANGFTAVKVEYLD
jgi:hypothetical protein